MPSLLGGGQAVSPKAGEAAAKGPGPNIGATGSTSAGIPLLPLRASSSALQGSGEWIYVSDLPLPRATTGWTAVADVGLPMRDLNFLERQMTLLGTPYNKGLGTYPLSEIEVPLAGQFMAFRSTLGVDDEAGVGNGSVVFHIFLDDVEVFTSKVMRSWASPVQIDLPVAGANTMRLIVTDAGDGSMGDYADWADAMLFLPEEPPMPADTRPNLALLEQKKREQAVARADDAQLLKALSAAAADLVDRALADPLSGSLSSPEVVVGRDPWSDSLVLANQAIAIVVGYGKTDHGYLSVFDRHKGQLILREASAMVLAGDRLIDLHSDTQPGDGAYVVTEAEEIGLGPGKRMTLEFLTSAGDVVALDFALYQESPVFTYQITVYGTLESAKAITYRFFDHRDGAVLTLGSGPFEYLTDQSRIRQGRIADDGLERQELVGYGKPVFIWNDYEPQGLILALLDPATNFSKVTFNMPKGHVGASLGYSVQMTTGSGDPGRVSQSPRLFVELTDTTDTRFAFANFKQVSQTLYPPLPMPSWVRYQWLSWYVYYMGIDEQVLKDHIDYIAENLADLGQWHIIVDAGWYVAEGRDGAEWRNVDTDKFPSGLADLVAYAHARGIKVVLYFSAPYLNDEREDGNWLGLKGIIDNHPEWLIPLSQTGDVHSYVYDFDNPALRRYLESVMEDFFVRYGVDGIKIDGLGNAQIDIKMVLEQEVSIEENKLEMPTLPIYQFIHDTASELKDDIYFESGWSTPQFAQAYAHTFRYGDEQSSFDFPYPFGGLRQHIDYAILQETMLGQRANMGAIRGHPDEDSLGLWWLGAALALGTQVSLSFDFTTLSPESLSTYRCLLNHYEPFAGETYFGGPLFTDTFATTKNELTYLGVINRDEGGKGYTLSLSDYGLNSQTTYLVYDVFEKTYQLVKGHIDAILGGQQFKLYILRATPGLVWSNSSVSVSTTPRSLTLNVSGPQGIRGFVEVYAPDVREVRLDGEVLPRSAPSDETEEYYLYDEVTGMLTVQYSHDWPHTIKIELG